MANFCPLRRVFFRLAAKKKAKRVTSPFGLKFGGEPKGDREAQDRCRCDLAGIARWPQFTGLVIGAQTPLIFIAGFANCYVYLIQPCNMTTLTTTGRIMETKVVRFTPHRLDSPEVQARLAQGSAPHMERMERIQARIAPHMTRFNARINALIRSRRNADYCIPEFWRIVDEMMAFNKDDVGCKRGCSHCCHIQVLVTQDEADVIGKRIGRKAAYVKPPGRGRKDVAGFDTGYHNPCTFLVDGECSIYENRPLPCRLHYTLDVDGLLCELAETESPPVPYLNPHPFMMAFLQMLGAPDVMPILGDIRELFPKVTK